MGKEKRFDKAVADALIAAGAAGGFVIGLGIAKEIMKIGYKIKVEIELREELGDDFIDACKQDEECRKKLEDLVSTVAECKVNEPSREEWERKKRREALLEELRKSLGEMGIEIRSDYEEYEGYRKCWVRIGDIEFYGKDCEVIYKGEVFDIDEVV